MFAEGRKRVNLRFCFSGGEISSFETQDQQHSYCGTLGQPDPHLAFHTNLSDT